MANAIQYIFGQVNENLTENAANKTGKTPSTPEGMAVAYGSLVVMAMLPIFFGSYRSVIYHKEKVKTLLYFYFTVFGFIYISSLYLQMIISNNFI